MNLHSQNYKSHRSVWEIIHSNHRPRHILKRETSPEPRAQRSSKLIEAYCRASVFSLACKLLFLIKAVTFVRRVGGGGRWLPAAREMGPEGLGLGEIGTVGGTCSVGGPCYLSYLGGVLSAW